MRAELLTYPIAFLYSPASIKLDWTSANALRRSAVTASPTIYDAASPTTISPRAPETTDCFRVSYRILTASAAAVASRSGDSIRGRCGIVIADLRPRPMTSTVALR